MHGKGRSLALAGVQAMLAKIPTCRAMVMTFIPQSSAFGYNSISGVSLKGIIVKNVGLKRWLG